jgi:anti-anti-sigma factor
MVTGGRIVLRLSGDAPVLALLGEFDLSNVDDLRNALATIVDGHGRCIVFDLSETAFLDSTILGVLAHTCRDNDVTVRGARGVARNALEVSGLIGYMHDEDSEASKQEPSASS